jgi:hypothetical protein
MTITLAPTRSLTRETNGAKVSLYLAFPDGVFHYVCAECTALCCRWGDGFAGSLQREIGPLLSLYPALETMAKGRRGNLMAFATPAGRCHFLDQDNGCRIEKEHGKALKPGVCVLFPFNAFTRVGNTIAVSPHFKCPLRLQVPARPGQVEGTHAFIEQAVHETGLIDQEYLDLHLTPVALHPSADAQSVLRREAIFRDTCSQALGQGGFTETLRGASEDPARLDASVARAAALLGLVVPNPTPVRDAVDDLLHALAPSLRLGFLQLAAEGILVALALGQLVLRQAVSLSSGPATPQGAYQILSAMAPALRLLARTDEPLEVPRKISTKVPPFGDPAMTFAGYRVLRAGCGATGTLAVLEEAMDGALWRADRTAFLVELGTYLENARPRRARQR